MTRPGTAHGHGRASAGVLSRGRNRFANWHRIGRNRSAPWCRLTVVQKNTYMATRTDLLTVREYFSSDEWDLIDAALSEYQDHYDTDEEAATYNTLVGRIAHLFTINTDATD